LADGFLEEVLVHEAGHTSFDAEHAQAQGWLDAQAADPDFISTYARDNPFREDISESLLTYYAFRHTPDRISQVHLDRIGQANPNRIAYFDALDLDWYPMVTGTRAEPQTPDLAEGAPPYPNPSTGRTTIPVRMIKAGTVHVSIYDLLGRRVAQLHSEFQGPGTHEFQWDGTNSKGVPVRSGSYLISVKTQTKGESAARATSSIVVLVR
jgi:hypothetical protein